MFSRHTVYSVKFEISSFNKATENIQERNMKLTVEAGLEEADK
jgi:hypothetical protein